MSVPALSIPPEITSIIFEHCLSSQLASPEPNGAPLLLAQICARWREICLSTPTLWASVAFGEEGAVQLLHTWLRRTGDYPLTLSLSSADNTRAQALMDVAALYFDRWCNVRLSLPPSAYRRLSAYLGSFSLLKNLELAPLLDVPEAFAGNGVSLIRVHDAPYLTSVSLEYTQNHGVELPWAQLTELHFRWVMDARQIVPAIERCPKLLHLSCLLDIPGAHAGLQHITPFTHKSIRSLNLSSETPLLHLTLPRLEQLALARVAGGLPRTADLIREMVARSSCALRCLSLGVSSRSPVSYKTPSEE